MKKDIAKNIIERLNNTLGELSGLLQDVESELSEAEYSSLKRAVARIMSTVDIDIIRGIVDEYPELSPWDL